MQPGKFQNKTGPAAFPHLSVSAALKLQSSVDAGRIRSRGDVGHVCSPRLSAQRGSEIGDTFDSHSSCSLFLTHLTKCLLTLEASILCLISDDDHNQPELTGLSEKGTVSH